LEKVQIITISAACLVLLVLIVSMGYPVQAGVNGTLSRYLGHPLLAAPTNTVVASITLFIMAIVFRAPLPSLTGIAFAP